MAKRTTATVRVGGGRLLVAWWIGMVVACDSGGQEIPAPDPELFVQTVYPVLLRDCSFPACHGHPNRPLFLPGPGRTRLDVDTELFDPPTVEEVNLAYARTRGLLGVTVEADGQQLPLLLEKTLGHAGHAGRDRHGKNVYEHRRSLGWKVLQDWAMP